MFNRIIFCYGIIAISIVSSNTISDLSTALTPILSGQNVNSKIMVVDDISKARAMFPNAKFSALNRVADNLKGTIVYTLGQRVNGDKVVATDSDSGEWATAKDVELLIQYPHSGRGAIVTYVVVLVDQGSNVGDGYVVSGGIGQRQIGFVIEAKGTTFLNYDAFIYGRP